MKQIMIRRFLNLDYLLKSNHSHQKYRCARCHIRPCCAIFYSNLGFLNTRSSISREDFRSPLLSTESGSPLMHWNSATIYPSWLQIYTKPYYDSFIASWQGSFCFVNFCKNSSFAWLTLIPITSYGVQYLIFLRVLYHFCQTPLQLANPTQLQLVGVGVDFVFLRKEGERRTILT